MRVFVTRGERINRFGRPAPRLPMISRTALIAVYPEGPGIQAVPFRAVPAD